MKYMQYYCAMCGMEVEGHALREHLSNCSGSAVGAASMLKEDVAPGVISQGAGGDFPGPLEDASSGLALKKDGGSRRNQGLTGEAPSDDGVSETSSVSAETNGGYEKGGKDLLGKYSRLRVRGVHTRECWASLVSMTEGRLGKGSGGRTSFSSLSGWMETMYGPEVKLTGVQRVEVGDSTDLEESVSDPVGAFWKNSRRRFDYIGRVTIRESCEVLTVSLSLLARLSCYMAFRPRDEGTLLLLRAKCDQYARALGLPHELLCQVLPGTVAVGMMVQAAELDSLSVLGEVGQDILALSEAAGSGAVVKWVDRSIQALGLVALTCLAFVVRQLLSQRSRVVARPVWWRGPVRHVISWNRIWEGKSPFFTTMETGRVFAVTGPVVADVSAVLACIVLLSSASAAILYWRHGSLSRPKRQVFAGRQ
jgi:hypothetical protein